MPQNPWDNLEEVKTSNPWDSLEQVETPAANPWESLPVAETDMDLPEPEQIQLSPAQMPEPTIDTTPSVMDNRSILRKGWDRLRSPLTNIGSRIGEALSPAPAQAPDPMAQMYADLGSVIPKALGYTFDQSTAPLDLAASLGTAGASKFGIPALKLVARGASALTAASGGQRVLEAESIPEALMGGLEMAGGIMGARGTPEPPSVKPKIKVTAKMEPTLTPLEEATKTIVPNTKAGYPEVKAAKKILEKAGISPTGTAEEIVNMAEGVMPGFRGMMQKPVELPKEVVNPVAAAKLKGKMNVDGTWSPTDQPDLKLDKEGRVVGTKSGNPVNIHPEQERSYFLEAANLPRALQASMDLSFPLRQGLGLIHKGAWWKSWGPMVRSFGSDKAYQGVMDSIRENPLFRPGTVIENGKIKLNTKGQPLLKPSFAEEAGLALTDNLTVREHEFMNKMSEGLPGIGGHVKASNRAYTAFANKLRADTFNSLVEDFKKAGVDVTKDMTLAKELASFVNASSGRGGLGPLERHAEALNASLFSPRLISSRMQMMGQSAAAPFDPRIYSMTKPAVRKEYLKSMLALGSAWATMAGAAKLAGADVSLDPTSADFGKLRFGDTRLDPAGGFQQFIVLAVKMALGQSTNTLTGETKDLNTPLDRFGKPLGNFTINKLSPVMKYAWDLLSADKSRPFDMSDRTVRMVLPIVAQDLAEIMNAGKPEELMSLPFAIGGMGTQTYGPGDMERRVLPFGIGEGLTFPAPREY